MIIVNVGPVGSQSLLQRLYLLPYGRASVLFVVVAGIGMGYLLNRRPERERWSTVTWRAALLFAGGVALQELTDQVRAPALPGAAVIQMMQVAEAAGIADVDPDSPEYVDILSRAWQVADTSVQRHFGDPRFVDVPVERLTDPDRNAQIAAALPDAAETSSRSAALAGYEGAPNTTHISVVDADGRAVSMTNTITNYWGSGQYVAGFFVNNQLARFGDVGIEGANRPEPGRRSVTWSSPSMLLDAQQRPVLVLGTPGGRQIPSTVANVVARWALHDQPLETAVRAGRFYLTDGELRLETPHLADALRGMGYDVVVTDEATRPSYGSVQALAINWDTGRVNGFADERRSAGFVVGRTG